MSKRARSTTSSTGKLPPTKSWNLGIPDELENNKRFFNISVDNNPIYLTINNVMSPFDISEYDSKSTRKGLVLELEKGELETHLEFITESLKMDVIQSKSTIFVSDWDDTQVRQNYRSVFKQKENYPSSINAKVMTGYTKTRFWDKDRKPTDSPTNFAGIKMNVKLHFRGIFVTSDSWGLVIDITDAQLISDLNCPF